MTNNKPSYEIAYYCEKYDQIIVLDMFDSFIMQLFYKMVDNGSRFTFLGVL